MPGEPQGHHHLQRRAHFPRRHHVPRRRHEPVIITRSGERAVVLVSLKTTRPWKRPPTCYAAEGRAAPAGIHRLA
ncbi:type II toxin-antitoxin system prevent-host-death family antitoxin (plasmid) [Xanthomonas axonopodis pv. vasculorum]